MRFARDVEKIVREAGKIFGELPKFDGGTYTFLADYLPWADGDGMEHRNSTVRLAPRRAAESASAPGHPRHRRARVLPLVEHGAHPRARPSSRSTSKRRTSRSELWFGEGFTNYFDGLILERAGLMPIDRRC